MGIGLTYVDSVQLIKPYVDGYGTEIIEEIETVPAIFIQNTGWSHGSNRSNVTSDAEIYIDPESDFVQENWNLLDGFMVIANPFCAPEGDSWYRVVNVRVGQDKLLDNKIDNILLQLEKTTEIGYVS